MEINHLKSLAFPFLETYELLRIIVIDNMVSSPIL